MCFTDGPFNYAAFESRGSGLRQRRTAPASTITPPANSPGLKADSEKPHERRFQPFSIGKPVLWRFDQPEVGLHRLVELSVRAAGLALQQADA